MLEKILIAIGDSPESELVLANGLTIAEKLGAQILILHVLNPLIMHGFDTIGSPLVGGILPIINERAIAQYTQQWQEYERQGQERLASYLKQASDRQIQAEVLQKYGDSGPMICETAKSWSADAIVMGRNQKPALSEIFLGSTSNYVLHHANCSVMAIQSRDL
jgi:nucleotide-binding universal stress UspA family protein